MAASLPLPMFILFYCCLPECPRWLLSKGRNKEAKAILKKAAQINGTPNLEPNTANPLINVEDSASSEDARMSSLFKAPNLRRITLVSWFIWFTNIFAYYGLTLNADTLIPGDIYVTTAISGLIEIPAYLSCMIVLHYMGRRLPLLLLFLTSGTLLITTSLMEANTLMMVIVMVGKFCIVCIGAIIHLHASEMFPTVVRSTGLGSCSMWGRLGSMLASIIGRELGQINRSLAIAIFAFPAFISAILTLTLPETKDRKLPDTITEGKLLHSIKF